MAIIRDAIAAGATYFVRSDIKEFFTRIKTTELISEIDRITDDAEFANIVADGPRVELKNADRPWVREWIELFPDGNVGVPQGSSLSTFCANFVLREFDCALNRNGLVTVRYIDDFVILGHSRNAVTQGWAGAKSILRNLDLEVHEPEQNGEKASSGQVSRGFEFLSYRFCGKCVGLSGLAKSAILTKVDEDISVAKNLILHSWAEPRRAQARFAQSVVGIDRRVRGWGDSFRDVDQRVEFKQIDDKICDKIGGYIGWYSRIVGELTPQEKMRALGVALLHDTPYRDATEE